MGVEGYWKILVTGNSKIVGKQSTSALAARWRYDVHIPILTDWCMAAAWLVFFEGVGRNIEHIQLVGNEVVCLWALA